MRRLLLAALAALAAVVSVAAPAQASTRTGLPTVELLTVSQYVTTADLQAALPAFQTAVSRDFAPAWGQDATLFVGDPAHPSPATMTITVSDTPDCLGCGGYHDRTARRQPYAKVFWLPDESWQLILTHELFEMLADPQANRYARYHDRTWLVEVGDPVESGFYAYRIGGVVISDFILPAWYDAGATGPYDFAGALRRPGQVGRHGYASWRTDDGRWHQVFD